MAIVEEKENQMKDERNEKPWVILLIP